MLPYPSAAFRASAPRGTVLELWDGKDVPSGLNVGAVNGRIYLSKLSLSDCTLTLLDASGTVPLQEYANVWTGLNTFRNAVTRFQVGAATDAVGFTPTGNGSGSFLNAISTNTLTANRVAFLPDANIEVQGAHDVVFANWQARNHGAYTAAATATATDPATPASGHEFTTLVRNGTITIGGTAYSTAGSVVRRVWHASSWANYEYPHLAGANTWTAAQVFNLSTTIGTATGLRTLTINGADSGTNGGAAIYLRQGAATNCAFGNISAIIGGAYDGTTAIYTAGGVPIKFYSSSTVQATLDANGNLGIGTTPTAGNGLLQLASGTTKANGIAFGTDTFIHRQSPGIIYTGNLSSGDSAVYSKNGTVSTYLYCSGTTLGIVGCESNTPLDIRTNNVSAITVDTAQGVSTKAANYVKIRSVTSAAGTTTLDGTDDTAILTGSTTQTFTLPAASAGRRLFVKNRSSGALTVNRAGSDTIDGGTTLNVASGTAKVLIANGTDWCVWNA